MKDNSYRHLRMLVVVLCALIVMLSMALPAYAQDGRPGQLVFGGNYTLESGETLTGDLGIAGGNAVLDIIVGCKPFLQRCRRKLADVGRTRPLAVLERTDERLPLPIIVKRPGNKGLCPHGGPTTDR